MTHFAPPRRVEPADIALPAGYRIEAVATGLTFPTGVVFDDRGAVYVTEAGYAFGEVWANPRLLRVEPDGSLVELASGNGAPWNGAVFDSGAFYVTAAGGFETGGKILRIGLDGTIATLTEGLPSLGDHRTNGPLLGPDGWLYFGQGTATNSGVVGPDNFEFGWVDRYPDLHDVPCRDLTLAGRNFTTPDPFVPGDDRLATGAFVPFGTPTREGQLVQGRVPCNGAILRIQPTGGAVELVAWGLRNPSALAWGPDGGLYATDNQYEDRGSRPVFGTGDLLWRIVPGTWYGWPDFHAGRPLTDANWYRPPTGPAPGFVLNEHPGIPPRPAALLAVHSSASGLDFSRNSSFGHVGEAFITEFGDMAPIVGKILAPVGYKVVRVDVETGIIQDFAINRGKSNGPASWLGNGGLERPVAARFSPDGSALYVVDFGVITTEGGRPEPRTETGVLWRISRISDRE
jgi:glucose/arabinose dehydrogenase